MPIVCPHCSTSYAVDPATLGAAGRTVRCARCKQVWLASPEDARALVPSLAGRRPSAPVADWTEREPAAAMDEAEPPVIESPSIASAMPNPDEPDAGGAGESARDGDAVIDAVIVQPDAPSARSRRARGKDRHASSRFAVPLSKTLFSLPTACAAMAALIAALIFWRSDVVRLLPQTASFYSLVGLDVNLRGLSFKDVKLTTETVEGKAVLVIEGNIVAGLRTPVELPRLRFVVRDARGADIYAWNAVLDQAVLKPGEKAWFRSRLAVPPADGRSLDIRFFNRRDIASGGA